MTWQHGKVIVHRELWRGQPWCVIPQIVVADARDELVTYLPEEAPFAFPPRKHGPAHPWAGKTAWVGHGVLVVRRPGEACSVFHFWEGPERRFAGWYVNLEEPFRRTAVGYDTQDLELDLWLPADGPLVVKDEEMVEQRVREGRFTKEQARAIRALGAELREVLDRGERWWDEGWASFVPDPAWRAPAFPDGWETTPPTEAPPPSAYRRSRDETRVDVGCQSDT